MEHIYEAYVMRISKSKSQYNILILNNFNGEEKIYKN